MSRTRSVNRGGRCRGRRRREVPPPPNATRPQGGGMLVRPAWCVDGGARRWSRRGSPESCYPAPRPASQLSTSRPVRTTGTTTAGRCGCTAPAPVVVGCLAGRRARRDARSASRDRRTGPDAVTSAGFRAGTGTWEISGCSGRLSTSPGRRRAPRAASRRGAARCRRSRPAATACAASCRATSAMRTGSAHVEHQRLAVAADRGGLDDQLHRLLHRHEVAGDVGVGDGDRAARRRSARWNAVSTEPRLPRTLPKRTLRNVPGVTGGGVRGEPLGDPLGVAEHADRVGGLVGGDVDEPRRRRAQRRSSTFEGAPDVRLAPPRRGAARSSGRCLSAAAWKTTCGPALGEDLARCRRRRGCRRGSVRAVEQRPAAQRQLHGVQRRLVAVEHHQLGRVEAGAICRHSSEPIEPPAPVTSTRWPVR